MRSLRALEGGVVSRRVGVAVAVSCGPLLSSVHGQFIWDGGGTNGRWDTATNWSTDVIPGTGAVVQFAGSSQPSVDLRANRSVASLAFNSGASAFTLSNNILTFTGSGTVLANNSTATQTINSALQFNISQTVSATSGNLVLGGAINIGTTSSARTLTFTGAFDQTVTGVIGGSRGRQNIAKSGLGTLTLSGANTFSGAATLNEGTLRATTNAAALGAGRLTLAGGTLSLANNTGLNFGRSTTLAGSANIESDRLAAGAGVTHTLGALTVSGDRSLTFVAGSNVSSGTAGLTFGSVTLGGNFNVSTGANTQLNLGALAVSTARTVTKSGAGVLSFTAAPSSLATGSALVVQQGTARLGATNALGTSALVNVTVNANSGGGTALFDLNGFSQSVRSLIFGGAGGTSTSVNSVATGAGTLTLGGDVAFDATGSPLGATLSGLLSLGAATRAFAIADSVNAGSDLTVSAVISGAGGLTKTGDGTLTFSGANTYTGATAIQAGVLSVNTLSNLSASSALGAPTTAAAGTIALGSGVSEGTLRYTGAAASTNRVINLAGTTGGGVIDASGAGALTLTSALTATGAGAKTLTLRGANTADNTFAGAIVDNSISNPTGIVKADTGTWVLSGANGYTGSTTVSGGVLKLGSSSSLPSVSPVVVNATAAGGDATLNLNGFNATAASLTFGGATGGVGASNSVATGAGTLTMGGNVVFDASGSPSGATLSGKLDLGASTRTFAIDDSASASDDLLVSAEVSGASGVGLVKTGDGTLTLSGANTYAGPTTVSAGVLKAGAANVFSSASAVTVGSGGVLNLGNGAQTIGSLAGAGQVSLGSGTLTLGGDNSSTSYTGVAYGSGGLTKTGSGTLTLGGANTYTGTTTVSGGTLALSASQNLDSTSGLVVGSGATFDLAGQSQTVGAFSGAGTVATNGGAFTAGNSASGTFSGAITGSGSFAKLGSGTLGATGANSLSGALSVSAGTLALSGASGAFSSASSVSLAEGGILLLDNSSAANANRIGDGAALNLNGGDFILRSASAGSAESLGLLNAGAGLSSIVVQQTGSGAASLTFSGLGTISPSATVDFGATGGSLGASVSGPQIYITGLGAGFIGGWATVGANFAEYGDYGVRAFTGYYAGSDGINVNDPAQSIVFASSSPLSAYTLTNAGTTRDGSLLITDAALIDLNSDASRTLVLATGGLLKTTATNSVVSGLGRLSAGSTSAASLSVNVQSTGKLTINSGIVNNAGADAVYGTGDDGAVAIVKAGPGELVLGGANTHSGGTQLDAGTLTLANNAAAGIGSFVLNGGTLQASGGARSLANAVTLGGNIVFSSPDSSALTLSGPVTLTGSRTLTNSSDLTLSGAIGGAYGLTKAGAGSLTFSGSSANTYSGATTVNAGTLLLDKSAGNAIAGALVIGDGAGADTVRLLASNQIADTSSVTLGVGAVLDLNGNSDTFGAVTLAGASTLSTGAGTFTLGGNVVHDGTGSAAALISGKLALGSATRTFTIGDSAAATDLSVTAVISGAVGLTKAGAGTLSFSGANTYTGATTISAGTLRTEAAGSLSASSALTVGSGATLDLNGFNQTVASLAGSGTVSLGSAFLTAGGNDSSTTFTGVIGGSGGLTKTGTGTLTLGTASSYAGLTTVSAGTLAVTNAGALGGTAGGTTVVSGAAVTLSGTIAVGAEPFNLAGTGGGSGALRSVSGANSVSGPITLSAGTTIGASTGASLSLGGPITTAGYTVNFSAVGGIESIGVIGGAGGLTKTGAGTLTLSGTNTYAGATTISTGTVVAANGAALGSTAGGTGVASGATLELSNSVAIGAEALSLVGTGVGGVGALRNSSGSNSLAGAVTLGGATTIASEAGTLTLSGAVNLGSSALTLTGSGSTLVSGDIGGVSGSILKAGAGTVTFSGANAYTGVTTISSGTLVAASGSALGAIGAGTTVASGAALALLGNVAVGAEPLTLAGTGVGGAGALVNLAGDNSFDGAITLSGATTIASADGILTLSGSLDTAGNTLVLSGDGDINLGLTLALGTGFTKTDNGTVALTAAQNNSTGTISLAGGTLDLAGLDHTIGTLNVTADSILDFSGDSTLRLTSINVASGVTLTVSSWVDLTDLLYSVNDPATEILGRIVFTSFTASSTKWNAFDSQITPVPEPASYGFALAAGLGLTFATRRRRRPALVRRA